MSSNSGNPALDDALWSQARKLAEALDASQLSWLSGFFAGVAHDSAGRSGPAVLEAAGTVRGTSSPVGGPADRRIAVPYGSETGNGASVAATLAERLRQRPCERSHAVVLLDMTDRKPRQLAEAQDLLIVTSTYGDGDPPQPATAFFQHVQGRKGPKLDDVRYAVLALGDSTCEQFCAAGRRLGERLCVLGARHLLPRHGFAEVPITLRVSGCPNGCSRPYIGEVALTGRAIGRYNLYLYLGGGAHGRRFGRLYLENADEAAIVAALGHYARERHGEESFGDFVIRAGYVTPVTSGPDFKSPHVPRPARAPASAQENPNHAEQLV